MTGLETFSLRVLSSVNTKASLDAKFLDLVVSKFENFLILSEEIVLIPSLKALSQTPVLGLQNVTPRIIGQHGLDSGTLLQGKLISKHGLHTECLRRNVGVLAEQLHMSL